jgi:hypothetical protein
MTCKNHKHARRLARLGSHVSMEYIKRRMQHDTTSNIIFTVPFHMSMISCVYTVAKSSLTSLVTTTSHLLVV